MNNHRLAAAAFSFAFVTITSAIAHADDAAVSIGTSQFTDKVDQSKPVGDLEAASHAKTVTYYVEANNPKDATEIVLVWKRDGHEVLKQHLDVGHSPRWRTWGSCPASNAKEMQVEVQDSNGHVLKTDTLAMK